MGLPRVQKVTPRQLFWLMINVYIPQKIPVFFWGDGGLGKSQIALQICKAILMKLHKWTLQYYDLTDLKGFMMPEDGVVKYMRDEQFPGSDIPYFHFWDEINRVAAMVANTAFEAINENQIAGAKFHPDSIHVATCNFEGIGIVKMSENLCNRAVHLELVADTPDWIFWADTNNIHHMIKSYLLWQRSITGDASALHNVKVIQDKSWPSPRTWEMASKLQDRLDIINDKSRDHLLTVISSAVGEAQGSQYVAYADIKPQLPNPQEIIDTPKTAPVPDARNHGSAIYAIQGLLSNIADAQNFDNIIEYARRLPPENAAAMIFAATGRDPDLTYCKGVTHFKRDFPGYFVDVA